MVLSYKVRESVSCVKREFPAPWISVEEAHITAGDMRADTPLPQGARSSQCNHVRIYLPLELWNVKCLGLHYTVFPLNALVLCDVGF